jgi:hypothetical protein
MPASYARVCVVKDLSKRGGDNGGKGGAKETPGWCTRRRVRPIAMVSFRPGNGGACGNPILVTCDFFGGIVIIASNRLSVAVRHEAFPPPASSSSSSSSRGGGSPTTLTHTKGGRINVDVDTCLSSNDVLLALTVGERERGARLLEVETGAVVWRVKNLPPEPRTLLQRFIWTTSIAFLCLLGGGAGDGAAMACGTARGQVQIYDVRSSSSVHCPAFATPEGMLCHCMTVLCQLGPGGGSCGGDVLEAGDAVGDVHLLDLRKLSAGQYARAGK